MQRAKKMVQRLRLESIALVLLIVYLMIWWIVGNVFLESSHQLYDNIAVDDTSFYKKQHPAKVVRRSDDDEANVEIGTNHPVSKETKIRSKPVLTAYVQSGAEVKEYSFPDAYNKILHHVVKGDDNNDDVVIHPFPIIDKYPDGDSFLPWIHDLHPSSDGTKIQIYAQNRRRCHTGNGNEKLMKDMEGQMALFQPIAIATTTKNDQNITSDHSDLLSFNGETYRVSSYEDANVHNETRFICRFKDDSKKESWITFSTYPFNYEYISWRKRMDGMFDRTGKDMAQFWLSSLQFHCPIPQEVQRNNLGLTAQLTDLYLDIIPVKTPVRYGSKSFFFHEGHGGPINFDLNKEWGKKLSIPSIESSTRWENIRMDLSLTPLLWEKKTEQLLPAKLPTTNVKKKKPFNLVACTWTSASHNRRGDAFTINDGKERLREWIAFHLLVGFDHIVVYDNSAATNNQTSLKDITELFPSDFVTYVDWPCKICNNNKPANKDPGERSSQYAAEASCRGRFAPYTEWMSFMDPDEYLIPMGKYDNWKDVLADVYKEGRHILKFRSTRARALPNLMKPVYGPEVARCPTPEEVKGKELRKASCLVRDEKYTFLQTYNCEYIKSPKPDRFQRAMKQIYRPDYVLSHFVHYSTVTKDLARTKDQSIDVEYNKYAQTSDSRTERFVDEINEGVLAHTKSIVPEEAVPREARCKPKLHPGCNVGIPCPDDLPFDDKTHQDGFLDHDGNYCNCWVNRRVENVWLPKLEAALQELEL